MVENWCCCVEVRVSSRAKTLRLCRYRFVQGNAAPVTLAPTRVSCGPREIPQSARTRHPQLSKISQQFLKCCGEARVGEERMGAVKASQTAPHASDTFFVLQPII